MEARVTVDEQIQFAAGLDLTVTTRQLARFRHEGLMPPAERTEHKGRKGVPTYPASSCLQLERLLTLPSEVRGSARVVSLALWGHPIELSIVQTALAEQLSDMETGLWEFIESRAQEGEDPLHFVAVELAGARPRGVAVPRARGQSLGARADAIELMLRLFMLGPPADQSDKGGGELERLIGMARARTDVVAPFGTPWMDGSWMDGFVKVGSLPAMRRAVSEASAAEIDEATRLARVFRRLLPMAATMIGAEWKRPNRAGLGHIQKMQIDPGLPEAMWLSFCVSVVRSPLRSNALEIVGALRTVDDAGKGLVKLMRLPAEEVAWRLSVLSRRKRGSLRRLMTVYEEMAGVR